MLIQRVILGVAREKTHRRKQLATLTTNILNPFLVSLAMIVLLSFTSLSSAFDAIKWSLILTALSVLPVFIVTLYLVRHQRLEGIFSHDRKDRTKVYVVASVFAITGGVILSHLGTPPVLLATYVAGLSAVVIFMCINFLWKISVHTAFVAASATILIVLFGFIGAVGATLLPAIAWARIELEHHSLAQTVTGALLAVLIVIVVFYLFGLVGRTTPA